MIILISDLLVDREPLFRGLEMLRHGRHDVLVFHVLDEEELTFPFSGTTRFEGMEKSSICCAIRAALRDGYIEALEEYLVEVRRGCASKGIDYMMVHTKEYLDAVLSKFLHHRMAMFKTAAKSQRLAKKYEIRISKSETNSKSQKCKSQMQPNGRASQEAIRL